VADKAYFEGIWGAGRVNVGAPRTYSLAAQFDF
jgi:iron complex outermembrane receptor protein